MVSQAEFQAAGFPVGGEPLGVDLADTLVTVTQSAADLLADPERCAAWWSLQSDRLPAGAGRARRRPAGPEPAGAGRGHPQPDRRGGAGQPGTSRAGRRTRTAAALA